MDMEEIHIFCKFVPYLHFSANDGGLTTSGNMRDIYTNGFLDTLRKPSSNSTFVRNRSK